jgi:hypothetical protein
MKLGGKTYILFLLLVFLGCQDVVLPSYDPQIVVEGWIEHDRAPIVLLSTTVSIDGSIKDNSDLKDHIIRWGKVTVSDGEKEVILTGKKDDRYFPPYIYTTSRLKGEAGKTYYLTVEYGGRTVKSYTTIPDPVPLEYIRCERISNNKTDSAEKYVIIGGLKDNPETKDYYKVFTKVHGRDSTFESSFLGLINDAIITEEIHEIPINKSTNLSGKIGHPFEPNKVVQIKFCTLDQKSWEYWTDFEEIQSLSRNPFFPITTDIRSNIQGGLGYWAGYGSTYYTVRIPSSE